MIPTLDQNPPIPIAPQSSKTSAQYNTSSSSSSSSSSASRTNSIDREDARIPKSSYSKESVYDSVKVSPHNRQKKTARRSSETKKSSPKWSSPKPSVTRRLSIESCSSINSMEEFPASAAVVTPPTTSAQEALHINEIGGDSSNSSNPADHLVSASPGVSFNKRVRIRKIKRLEDLSPEEIEATYFTASELMDIRNDLRVNIRALVENKYREDQHETVEDYNRSDDENNDIDNTTKASFCVRGLEHEFPHGKFRRKQLKMMSRGAVLEEQRLQREFRVGGYSPYKNQSSLSSHSTSTTSTYDSSIRSFATITTMNSSSGSGGGGGVVIAEDADVAISEIYRIESKPAVQLALEYGKRDESIADQIYFAHQAI